MMRKLFNGLTLVSVVLLAVTAWWWVHSGSSLDQVTFQRDGGSTVRLLGADGKVKLTRASTDGSAKPSGQVNWSSSNYDRNETGAVRLTAFSYTSAPNGGRTESELVLPAWVLAFAFSALPAWWVAKKFKGKGGKKKPAPAH